MFQAQSQATSILLFCHLLLPSLASFLAPLTCYLFRLLVIVMIRPRGNTYSLKIKSCTNQFIQFLLQIPLTHHMPQKICVSLKKASLVAQRVKRSLRYNYLQCHRLSIAKILWEQSETVIFARTLIRLAQDTPDRNDYSLSSRKTRSLSPLRTGRNLSLCFSLGTWM